MCCARAVCTCGRRRRSRAGGFYTMAMSRRWGRRVEERLGEVRVGALQQQEELRELLAQDDERIRGDLASQLGVLVREFLVRGLNVELVAAELATDPPAPITAALVGAVREALANVRKHAGVDSPGGRGATSPGRAGVVVRDSGGGF